MIILFVGERPSPTALRRGWTWADGRLAAAQLFDAFEAIGFDRSRAVFANAFQRGHIARIRAHAAAGGLVVAMGLKAQARLETARVPFLRLVHPAARGSIRQKGRYAEHVRSVLGPHLGY